MRVSHGNLLVSMNKCDTSHRDETLFNAADATGEYDLDLQVSTQNLSSYPELLPRRDHLRSAYDTLSVPRACCSSLSIERQTSPFQKIPDTLVWGFRLFGFQT